MQRGDCARGVRVALDETGEKLKDRAGRLILFCGMSIGYEDPTVSYVRTGRAPLGETVKFVSG